LKHFHRLQQVFTKKQVSKLKWEKQINVQKLLDKKANEITRTKDDKKTLVAYGNGKVHPMIKGYVKTPLKKLYLALKKNDNCSIFLADEFRTTKLCSNCHEVCQTSRSPHRFQVCPNCKKVWNRDINAARNILFKTKYFIETGLYPVKFSRESLTINNVVVKLFSC
jgi:transposase